MTVLEKNIRDVKMTQRLLTLICSLVYLAGGYDRGYKIPNDCLPSQSVLFRVHNSTHTENEDTCQVDFCVKVTR